MKSARTASTFPIMAHRQHRRFAFTLIEVLTVISIILIIFSLMHLALKGIVEGQRTEEAGRVVLNEINRARQHALTMNEVVEVRFIKGVRPGSALTAAQFWKVQLGTLREDDFMPVKEMTPLPQGMTASISSTLSPILTSLATKSSESPAYDYVAIAIRPSGQIEAQPGLSADDRARWCITFTPERLHDVDSVEEIMNFITIQIDPRTSRARIFRP